MRRTNGKWLLAATSLVAASVLVTGPVNATVVQSRYYACRTGATVHALSVLPHACAKGDVPVSGTFAGANFTNFNLIGANLAGAALQTTVLTRVQSGGIIGVPVGLPAGWHLAKGYLLGPTANLTTANLAGMNLSAISLASANLTGANLTNDNMSRANLTGTMLTRATLTNVVAAGVVGTPASLPTGWTLTRGYLLGPTVNLANDDLTGVNLANLNLTGANLSNATLTGVTLTNTTLASANLSGVTSGTVVGTPASLPSGWVVAGGYLVGPTAVLSNASLVGLDLRGVNLAGVNFFSADLTNANLTGDNLTGATLSYTTIDGTQLANTTLTGLITAWLVGTPASLPSGWQLMSGPYQNTDLTVAYLIGPGASLGSAFLTGAAFDGMNLNNIYMPGSQLAYTSFVGVTGQAANFSSSTFSHADFTNANFTGTNFTAADLSGANFLHANFTNVNFTGARFLSVSNRNTATFTGAICPDGVKYGQQGADCKV
jgi:uncharacterized protein YjbI with pentapeptide repeats